MPAVIKVGCFTGTSPGTFNDITLGTASVSFDLSATFNGTTTLTIPTSTNRTWSWIRYIKLYCLTGASTTLSNVKYALAAATATGIYFYAGVQGTYTVATGTQGTAAGNRPADDLTSSGAPTGSTVTYAIPTLDPTFSAAQATLGGAATTATPVGTGYLQCVVGVGGNYGGGGNANTALPNIEFQYDEA